MAPAIRVENLSKEYQIGAGPRGQYRTLRESIAESSAAAWARLRGRHKRPTQSGSLRSERASGSSATHNGQSRGGDAGASPSALAGDFKVASNGRATASAVADEPEGSQDGHPESENPSHSRSSSFWALKDVSFEVQPGEVVGIIGRNGAGKSTLLKILSRITEPTEGRIELRGRVASLLEVGTGFHPELTGRENIFLNGAILGMTRREIQRKFDEIVAFSEIEKFLDTPVKRYSSGMYVRLAFAVAAHLEPEILIVDEVLAVGDVGFQRKCIGKMQELKHSGRTVLLVSHQIDSLAQLCHNAIRLDAGLLHSIGPVQEIVGEYVSNLTLAAHNPVGSRKDRTGSGPCRLVELSVGTSLSPCSRSILMGEETRFTFFVNKTVPGLQCICTVLDHTGQRIAKFNSALTSPDDTLELENADRFTCIISEWLLAPGEYHLNVLLRTPGHLHDYVEAAGRFHVERYAVRSRAVPTVEDWKVALPHYWMLPPDHDK